MDEGQLTFAIVLAQTLQALAAEAVKCGVSIHRLSFIVDGSEEAFTMEIDGDNTFYLSPGWPD